MDFFLKNYFRNFTAKNLIDWFDNSKGWEDMSKSEYNDYYSTIQDFQKNFKAEYSISD